jgi:ATP-dependent exoDNAse (exonuclease V) alpha subunit
MAIYHLSVKPISRAGGRSATAAAAYRSGDLVHDLTSDEVFDYTRKRGVEHSEIVLPTAAARADINWARDREALWNAAEIAEVRKDARVAREYEVALPHELNRGQRVELVRAFSAELANR